jgi:hypothetical protein
MAASTSVARADGSAVPPIAPEPAYANPGMRITGISLTLAQARDVDRPACS